MALEEFLVLDQVERVRPGGYVSTYRDSSLIPLLQITAILEGGGCKGTCSSICIHFFMLRCVICLSALFHTVIHHLCYHLSSFYLLIHAFLCFSTSLLSMVLTSGGSLQLVA